MIKQVTNMWPFYSVEGSLALDSSVARAASGVLSILPEDLVDDVQQYPNLYISESSTIPGDAAGILTCLYRLNRGIRVNIRGTYLGSSLVRILTRIGRTDMLDRVLEDNMDGRPCEGVVLGMASLRNRDIFRDMICRPRVHDDSGGSFQKLGVMRSAIADCRRDLISGSDLSLAETGGTGHPGSVMNGDPVTAVMWMCNDPYRRIKSSEFNWNRFPKAAAMIREVFPFALPDSLDMDTRDRKGLVSGIMKILSWSGDRNVMDQYAVNEMLKAHIRLMDTGPAGELETSFSVNERLLPYCLFMKEWDKYLVRTESRIPRGEKLSLKIYLYGPWHDKLKSMVMYLESRKRIKSVSVMPVTLYEK